MYLSTEYTPRLSMLENPTTLETAGEPVGSRARRLFRELGLFRSARHPPVKAAFYPGIQDATVVAAIAVLLWIAGRPIKRATGKSLRSQAADMLSLWFQHRIDPPSYYAQDLYRHDRIEQAGHYLTRYETKNGLMATFNTMKPRPLQGHEMNDKALFAQVCKAAGVAHAALLGGCEDGTVSWHDNKENAKQDLFCKRRQGMGAKGAMTFRYVAGDNYIDSEGKTLTLSEIENRLKRTSSPMLVQPWLRNHEAIADLAKDSLLTVRVITSLNEQGEPEVCLAMLRILTVLEPAWQHLPDGEYGTPIHLASGELGELTGDSMATSALRYDNHPVTGNRITGRIMPHWEATQALARQLHGYCNHRVMVGWDIAITPDGPVMLEGNTNFDVMFLQRVQNKPASHSRLGALMNHHLSQLEAKPQFTL